MGRETGETLQGLRISLFGNLKIESDGKALHSGMRSATLRLLAFLLLRRQSPLTRDQIAFALWPDETEEAARTNLRRQLYNLRSSLPRSEPPFVKVNGEMVQWNPEASAFIDVVQFERLAALGDPEAVSVYSGDLLEGMDEEWLSPERERLRALYLETLEDVAAHARARRDGTTAERYLQRLLAGDPWREDALRTLMSIRYESGDAPGALRSCDEFAQRLHDELGTGLMPETIRLRDAITRHEPVAKPPVPNNLPVRTSSFVGRDEDVARIAALTREHRLVTIVGAGGVGKTRTATHVGAALLGEYDDGVWVVELAPLSDASLIPNTVAAALGIRQSTDVPMLETLLEDLRKRRLLLILDNCEHLVAAAAALVTEVLRHGAGVSILATSRESLRIPDEMVYRLPSLAYPSPNGPLSTEEAERFGAVALFAGRALAANPSVRLSDDTVPVVADICRRLDGIALAIELAAARVKTLSLPELARKLDDRFSVLSAGSRTALPRQQTMRALIDWSYDLLTTAEQMLLRRTAVFAGGWTLPSAQAVCADAVLASDHVFELLDSLVDKSLVVADVGEGTTRYRLLESTRAYARERLIEFGEFDVVARRLAEWVAGFADRMYDALWNTPTSLWLAGVETERENVRAALAWCLEEQREPVLAARIAGGFSGLWSLGGLREEGRRAIERALAGLEPAAHPAIEGRLWRGLAGLSVAKRQAEAAQRAIALFERCDDPAELGDAYRQLSSGLFEMDRAEEAEIAARKALELYRQAGKTGTRRFALVMQGRAGILLRLGRLAEARVLLSSCVTVPENLRDTAAAALVQMAELEFSQGNPSLAIARVREARAIGETLHDSAIRATVLCNAAGYHLALGQIDEARACAAQSLSIASVVGDDRLCTVAMLHLAAVGAEQGDVRRAALLFGYVDEWFRREHCVYEFTEQKSRDIITARLSAALGDGETATLLERGSFLSDGDALAQARLI